MTKLNWYAIAGSAIVAAILAVLVARMYYNGKIDDLNTAHTAELKKQKDQLNSDCLASKIFTQENSNAFHQGIAAGQSAIDLRFNDPMFVRPDGSSVCIPISNERSSLDGTGTSGTTAARTNGLPAQALRRIAKRGDERLLIKDQKLKACQAHVSEWERLLKSGACQ